MEKINPVRIDTGKCVGCSLCVRDCPSGYLYLEDKKAKTHESGCIECGHCFAICPVQAIDLNNYDTSDCQDVLSMEELDSKKLLKALKSRRTIRQFKDTPVEQWKIDTIIEAGRYCPTSTNSQNIAYTVINDKDKKEQIEKQCVQMFRKGQKLAAPLIKMLGNIHMDDNFFFKRAPLVILVSSKSDINGGLASSYMEIMAESMGLGVLYSGFFQACYKLSPKLRKRVRLPKGHKLISCMVIGYPSVKYQRMVPRKPVHLNQI